MKDIYKHLIHLDPLTEDVFDRPIYRVFSLEKFITSLHENSLVFVKTKLWEDPFEAFLLKQLIWREDGINNHPFSENLVENFYGQCWTFLKESNLLWKAYAPNNDGIIVKSTIRKLIELFVSPNLLSSEQYFIGRVEYWPQNEIIKYYENEDIVKQLFLNIDSYELIKSLFIKREEFKQEEEIRIVFYSSESYGKSIPLSKIGYSFERMHLFNELADELVLDPRIDSSRSAAIISLIKRLGYTGIIRHSNLFNIPNLKLRIRL